MLVRSREHALEARWLVPVVTVEWRDETTGRAHQRVIAGLADAQVVFVLEDLDPAIALCVAARDFERRVRRSIVDDDHLPGGHGLRLHRLDGTGDEVGAVVRRHRHGDLGGVH